MERGTNPHNKQTTMTNTTYNGYKNFETWNIALWIQNDEGFYTIAQGCDSYTQWLANICDDSTPDGVSYFCKELDVARLDEMILEM